MNEAKCKHCGRTVYPVDGKYIAVTDWVAGYCARNEALRHEPAEPSPEVAPATQHRVIPVEWHRVAVEPARKMPISGGGHVVDPDEDNAPAMVEPLDEIMTRIYRRFKEWSNRKFSADDVTWCEVRADVLAIIRTTAAQPANTDDRTADTIPGDLKLAYELYRKSGLGAPAELIERTGRAETRIEVLEAALRLNQRALLSGEQMDGLGERYALDGALVIEACTAIRAALAAPSGETKKV